MKGECGASTTSDLFISLLEDTNLILIMGRSLDVKCSTSAILLSSAKCHLVIVDIVSLYFVSIIVQA